MDVTDGAAEEVVKVALDGVEVAAKITGTAAKEIALLLLAAMKHPPEKKKGRSFLSAMMRQNKPLSVFAIPQKDLKTFVKHAQKYGILYSVIRSKNNKDGVTPVDIIARAEDAPKIQRIVEKFGIGIVEHDASIIPEVEKEAPESAKNEQEKTPGQKAIEEALEKPVQKDENAPENPTAAQTERNVPSGQDSEKKITGTSHEGTGISSGNGIPETDTQSSNSKDKAEPEFAADRNSVTDEGRTPPSPVRQDRSEREQSASTAGKTDPVSSKNETPPLNPDGKVSVRKKLEGYKAELEGKDRSGLGSIQRNYEKRKIRNRNSTHNHKTPSKPKER